MSSKPNKINTMLVQLDCPISPIGQGGFVQSNYIPKGICSWTGLAHPPVGGWTEAADTKKRPRSLPRGLLSAGRYWPLLVAGGRWRPPRLPRLEHCRLRSRIHPGRPDPAPQWPSSRGKGEAALADAGWVDTPEAGEVGGGEQVGVVCHVISASQLPAHGVGTICAAPAAPVLGRPLHQSRRSRPQSSAPDQKYRRRNRARPSRPHWP